MNDIRQSQVDFFNSGVTKGWDYRKIQLTKLKQALWDYREEIISAVQQDLRNREFEIIASELMIVVEEIDLFLKKGKKWAQTTKVSRSFFTLDSQGRIHFQPYGLILIIAPWNYPVHLSLLPLVGAIATGNCVILKPSEITPMTSSILAKLIANTFDTHYIAVVEGDAEVTQNLLKLAFDKIFFTGSSSVGKIIMEKAAKHFTPVTLELGGKSPVIIDNLSEDLLKKSLKRILWGKFINSGQTCIAPDYILLHKDNEELFKKILPKIMQSFKKEKTLCPIINEKHYQRVKNYLIDGEILMGGQFDDEKQAIELTIIKPFDNNSAVMQEEIFGPILPVITYNSKEEVKKTINNICPYPLALYVFTEHKHFEDYFINNISFGGASINDTISHVVAPNLPFGGVRSSGMGTYHGKASFECFSRQVSVLKKGFYFELPFRYPPYKRFFFMVKALFQRHFK